MSDHIILLEIMKRLPVKSLIRFGSVSKQRKSLINSSQFISNYHVNNTQPQHLLFFYLDPHASMEFQQKYVSIIDDETFPQQKFSLHVPKSVNQLHTPSLAGSSRGLFCIYNYGYINKAIIWNPSIRKSFTVDVPNVCVWAYVSVIGFGVCPRATDPKIVKITYIYDERKIDSISCIPSQLEVFSLTSGAWRTPSCGNLPRKSIEFTDDPVVIDGFIYWHVYDRVLLDHKFRWSNLIMSFNITGEDFREVYVPDKLANHGSNFSISKLKESLVVTEYDDTSRYGVWKMENGLSNSFTKVFSINTDIQIPTVVNVLGFRTSGEVIIEMTNNSNEEKLIVYKSSSEHISYINIGSFGLDLSCCVSSYMETLLLLDHSD